MKELKIVAPEGYEIDREKSTIDEIVFKQIKKQLPKTWEELMHYQKNKGGSVRLFYSLEQAAAYRALAKLERLRDVYRDGWEPNWENINENKSIIFPSFNNWNVDWVTVSNHFLSFQTREIAEEFLNNFRDLIEQAKPLMS